MPHRRCLICQAPTTGPRCPTCRRAQRAKYSGDWPQRSRDAIAAHVAAHGWTCPGVNTPGHPSTDLTLDHVRDDDATTTPTQVLCRACNTRKRRNAEA